VLPAQLDAQVDDLHTVKQHDRTGLVTLWHRLRAPVRDGFRARTSLAKGRITRFPALDRDSNARFAAEFRFIGLVVGPLWNAVSLTQVS
jgi:hypothetical protein